MTKFSLLLFCLCGIGVPIFGAMHFAKWGLPPKDKGEAVLLGMIVAWEAILCIAILL